MLPIPSRASLNSTFQPLSTSKGKIVGGTDHGGTIGLGTVLYNVCPLMILPSGTFQPLSAYLGRSVGGPDMAAPLDDVKKNHFIYLRPNPL